MNRYPRRSGSTYRFLYALIPFFIAALGWLPAQAQSAQRDPQTLTVGSFQGVKGQFQSIQKAIDAANPGDYVLIAPGDYHPSANNGSAGLYITTPNIHIRGLNRNRVIIDGAKVAGSKSCPTQKSAQNFGPPDENGEPAGRNGVWIRETSGVSVENLTICNFLTGTADERGNQLFFDGEEDEPIGLHGYRGAYISTTSSYFDAEHFGNYGLFASSSDGPGIFIHTYANNMADSDYYIGACPDCNAVIDDAHAENSTLGYSGTNSGGHIIIRNSEWDLNKAGIITNSQSVGDPPPPQDGACPPDSEQPDVPSVVQTDSCWVLRHNFIHNNNNPNVPFRGGGTSALVPTGVGVVVAGGRNDIIVNNRISNNGAWGVLLAAFPDQPVPEGGEPTPEGDEQVQPDCRAGANYPGIACVFDVVGVETAGNTFIDNGSFANPTNGDLAAYTDVQILPNFTQKTPEPQIVNCFHDNTAKNGPVTSSPAGLQRTQASCNVKNEGNGDSKLFNQILCATGASVAGVGCQNPASVNYPARQEVKLMALPLEKTMPNPCQGVPSNKFCQALNNTGQNNEGGGRSESGNGSAGTGGIAGTSASDIASSSVGGSGSGGCVMTLADGPFDPGFPLLLLGAAVYVARRRRSARKA